MDNKIDRLYSMTEQIAEDLWAMHRTGLVNAEEFHQKILVPLKSALALAENTEYEMTKDRKRKP